MKINIKLKTLALIITILLVAGSAMAAIWSGFNYLAQEHMNISPPENGIDTLVITSAGGYASQYDIGEIQSGDVIQVKFIHRNPYEEAITGHVYYEVECDRGLTEGMSGGMLEGMIIEFRDPTESDYVDEFRYGITHTLGVTGTETPVNTDATITWDGTNRVIIDPQNVTKTFHPGSSYYDILTLHFNNNLYGNYIVSGYVVVE